MTVSVGVLVMSYGTPRSPGELEAYYTHIRRGRAPSTEQLAELRGRYDAIGGVSPLRERTESQRAAIAAELDRARPGAARVVHGQKHADPFIEDAARELIEHDVDVVVGIVLTPHYSRASVGDYHQRARDAFDARAEYLAIDAWYDDPAFVEFQANAIRDELARLPARTRVVFTAHSLPERALDGDPYPEQLEASAGAIAAAAGLDDGTWSTAWQSAGRTPEPWRGPDILDVLQEIARGDTAGAVLVCPHGFVADHLEVLYDLDVQARDLAAGLGLAFARTRSINDDPDVMRALAARIDAKAAGR